MPPRNFFFIVAFTTFSVICYERAANNRYVGTVTQAMNLISEQFVEPVDDRQLFEGAMKGMVKNLDPYSDYMSPDDFRQLREDLDQEFGGVGIIVEIDPKSKFLIILSPLVDTPAYQAGLRAGDIILEIDGQSTEGISLKDSVKLMRGQPGSTVDIKVRPFGTQESRVVTLERAIIPVASVLGDRRNPDGTWEFTLEDYPNLAYIRLISFGDSSPDELRKVLTSLAKKNVDGLILDVRGNPGGLLTASVEICDMLIGDGRIVSTARPRWYNLGVAPRQEGERGDPRGLAAGGPGGSLYAPVRQKSYRLVCRTTSVPSLLANGRGVKERCRM